MHLTLATTYMAILTTGIFMTFLTVCLLNRNLLARFGYKLLALFVLFSFLRFLIPMEFSFTQVIALPLGISGIIVSLRHRLFFFLGQPVSIWLLFEYIWALGAIVGILHYAFSCLRARHYIVLHAKELTDTEPYQTIIADICREQNRANHFRVIELPGLNVPMLFGIFSPKILVPEHLQLSGSHTYYILRHEMTHHFHHDLILKGLVKIITLIYWWNPLCILLNKQTDVILEMRVDDSLTRSDTNRTIEYMNCLIDYASDTVQKAPFSKSFTMSLFAKKDSDLVKRFVLMSNNQNKTDLPFSILICCIVTCVYLCSYIFILEASKPPSAENADFPDDIHNVQQLHFDSTNDIYFIDNGDGTYDLYSGELYLETYDSTEYSYPGAPIYTPENSPYPITK